MGERMPDMTSVDIAELAGGFVAGGHRTSKLMTVADPRQTRPYNLLRRFNEARRIVPVESRKLALGMALSEHFALYPLCYFIDRYHPARGEPGVPPLLTNSRAFAQATWRHALFGVVLGRLVAR